MAATTFNIKTYVKNATKSIAYIAVGTVKDLNPAIAEFTETNGSVLREMYSAVRDYKKYTRLGKEALADSEYSKIAKETVSNFFDDLKTGNFYNKERENSFSAGDILGIDGFDDDWDMDLDNIDVDFGDSDDSLSFSGMDEIGSKIVKGTGEATIKSADYIVKAQRANTKGILAQNEMLFGRLNNSLYGINSTIAAIGKSIAVPMSTHINNSTTFYQSTTEQMVSQTAYLKQIYELVNTKFNPTPKEVRKYNNKFGNVGGSGIPDLKEYGNVIKENFKDMTSLITSVAGMMNMDGNGTMIRQLLSSPVASLMKGGSTVFMKKMMGNSLDRFNKSLSGLFGSGMLKLNQMGKNADPLSIKGIIANLLSIKTSKKNSMGTGSYEKGRVDWNGKDEKALRDVIPTQLAQILSALTGQEPKIFNYETGKWINSSKIAGNLRKELRNISNRNTSDIQGQFEKYYLEDNKDKNVNRQSKVFHSFQSDMQAFYQYLTLNNDRIPLNPEGWIVLEKKMKKTAMFADAKGNGVMLRSNFQKIRSYYQRNYDTNRRHLNMAANGGMVQGRNEINQFYTNQENDSSSVYGALFSQAGFSTSPAKNNFITNAIDDKGNNMFFYLQSFYSSLERIVENTNTFRPNTRNNRRRSNRSNATGDGTSVSAAGTETTRSFGVPDNSQANRPNRNRREFVDIDDEGAVDNVNGSEPKKKTKADEWKDRMSERITSSYESGIKNSKLFRKMGKTGDVLADLLEAPFKAMRNILDSADNMMYAMIYGKQDDTEDKGILNKIKNGFDETFATIKIEAKNMFNNHIVPMVAAIGDKFSNIFGFSTFKDMKEHIFNGVKNSGFAKAVGGELKSAGKWAKNAISGTVNEVGDYFSGGRFSAGFQNVLGKVKNLRRNREESQAAYGGTVTKSGMISVSEGEVVIPSERNPYYKGSINKALEQSKERSIGNKYKSLMGRTDYWGEYSKGGKVKENRSLLRGIKKGVKKTSRAFKKAKAKTKNATDDASEAAQQMYEDTMDDIRDTDGYKRTKSVLDNLGNSLTNGLSRMMARLFGKTTDDKGNPLSDEEITKNTAATMKGAWNEIKKYAPTIVAGGAIGAGASLITGMIGGPLLGAAVGSAIGLATKSEKFQEKLFGKQNEETGNYAGGFFGPQISTFINKQGSKLAKFGIAGAAGGALGLIPGGPIAGVIAGSALAFATQNDNLRNYLFGDEGLLGKNTDQKIKKAFPKMALGAGALAFTGPFGIMGNMMLGAGAGFLTESDKFKEAIFGVEDSNGNRQGGLLGIVKKDVINPMAEYFKGGMKKFEDYMIEYIFSPIKNVLRPLNNMIGNGLNKIGDFVKGKFTEHISLPFMKHLSNIFSPLTKVAGGIVKKGIGLVTGIAKQPGKLLDRVGLEIDRKQIKKGTSTSLSAEERALKGTSDFYLRNNNYKTKNYDKIAASMSVDDLQQQRDLLENYRATVNNNKSSKKDIRQNAMNRVLADSEYGTSLKEDKLLRKAFNESTKSGTFDTVNERVNQLIGGGKIDQQRGDKLLQYLKDQGKTINEIDSTDLNQLKEKAQGAADAVGTSLEDYMSGKNPAFRRLMVSDINKKRTTNAVEARGADAKVPGVDGSNPTPLDAVIHPITAIKDILTGRLDSLLVAVCRIAGMDLPEASEDSSTDARKKFNVIRRNAQTIQVHQAREEAAASKEEDGAEDTKVDTTEDGPVTYRRDQKGNWAADLRDAATKKALDAKNFATKQKDKLFASLSGISSSFNGLKEMLFGKKKDKKEDKGDSIFSKLFSGLGGTVSAALSGLPAILGGGLVTVLAGLGFNKTIEDKYGPKTEVDEEGNPIEKKQNFFGNVKTGFDKFENMITKHEPGKYDEGEYERDNLSDRYINNGIIKNSLIKGQTGNKLLKRIPIIGKPLNAVLSGVGKARNFVVDKSAGLIQKGSAQFGKAISGTKAGQFVMENVAATKAMKGAGLAGADKVTKKAFKDSFKSFSKAGVGNAAQAAAENVGATVAEGAVKHKGMFAKILSLCQSAISKALSFLGVKGGAAVAREGAEELVGAAAEAGAEKVSKSFAKCAALPIQLTFVIAAVQNGWEDARSILGIIDDPTKEEKILAAAINGINEAIPGIGGVIPSEYIFNILFTILNKSGIIDGAALQQKREEAKFMVDQHNAENGDTYNVREYVKNVLDGYTTQEKIGRGIADAGKSLLSGAKKGASAVVDGAKAAGNFVATNVKKGANFVSTNVKKGADFVSTNVKKGMGFVADGAKNLATGAKDLATGAIDLVRDGTKKVFDVVGYVKEGTTALLKMGANMANTFYDPEKSLKDAMATEIEISEDNPLKGIVKSIGGIQKIMNVPALFLGAIGIKIKKSVVDPFVNSVKSTFSSVMNTGEQVFEKVKNGDISGLIAIQTQSADEGNPLAFIPSAATLMMKMFAATPTVMSWIGHKVADGFKIFKQGLSDIGGVVSDQSSLLQYAHDGDVQGLFSADANVSDTNPFAFMASGVNLAGKVLLAPATIMGALGNKVKEFFSGVKAGFAIIGTSVTESFQKAKEFHNAHDISGLFTMNTDNAEDSNPLKFISTATDITAKMMFALPTVFGALGDKVKEFFGAAKKSLDVKQLIGDLWAYSDPVKHTDMKGFDDIIKSNSSDQDGVFGIINGIVSSITGGILKMVVSMIRPIMMVGSVVKDGVEKLGGIKDGVVEGVTNAKDVVVDGVVDGAKGAANWVGGKIEGAKDFLLGSGSGIHVSQRDPQYSNSKFGSSHTIGETGCGPAVAATILKRYGRNTSLGDTANYAKANGYVAGSSGIGTRASYFGDILGSNGINSAYTNNNASIRSAIGSGNPTILLGQDRSNSSKSNSPFGPNPHYVVAQGTDQRGNVIVDDPELGGTALYKKNILNNAKLGVVTGGNSGIKGDFIGKHVKKYESGNKGPDMISSGKGDFGGVSFGSYQFPSNRKSKTTDGNLPIFWKQHYASEYPNVYPGDNEAFKGAWKSAVAKDPTKFFNNEHSFVASQYYSPIAQSLASNGVGDPTTYDRAAQEAAWSTAVQYGPGSAAKAFKAAGVNNTMKPADYISKLYDYKKSTIGTKFRSSSADVRKSIGNRYTEEKQMLLGLAGQKPIDPNTTSGTVILGNTSTGVTDSSNTSSSSTSSGIDIGSIIDNVLTGSLTKAFGSMGSKGTALSSLFGFTNTDNNEATDVNNYTIKAGSMHNTSGTVGGDMANNFPYYNQADPRWGSKPYGKNTIQGAGCGPTAMAMVLKSYGKNVTPEDTIQYSMKNGHRVEGVGTSWDFFKSIGQANGLSVDQFTDKEKAKGYLKSGIPVIGSMKPGDFTKKGHFIVFSGLDGNTLKVNDPGSNDRTGRTWDVDQSFNQAKSFWSVSNGNTGSIKKSVLGAGSGLIVNDFTQKRPQQSNTVRDITRSAAGHAIRNIDSNITKYGGNSGVGNSEVIKSIQIALEYMKTIAENTSHNTNIKAIVEILASMMTLMGGKSSSQNVTNTENIQKAEQDTKDIMNKLKQLASAV